MNATLTLRPALLTAVTWCLAGVHLLVPAPARAVVHGGIEIGSRGVKAMVVDVRGEGEDVDFQVKLADTTNTSLVAGVAKTGRFDSRALTATAQAVKKYHERFRNEFQVAPERLHVVGSSGLVAPISDKPDLVKANQERLARAVKRETGLTMTFIDVKQEAELSIAGILPKSRRRTGVLIDIGGGNTKGGCLLGPRKYATFGVQFGSASFAALAKQKKAEDAKSLDVLCHNTVVPLLKKQLAELPNLVQRDRVYLSGGVVWAVATLTHPTAARAYTPLTLKDVEQLEAGLTAHPGAYPALDLSAVKDKQVRERALAEIARVKKAFRPGQLLAGMQILKSIYQELGDQKHYYFVRHGYLGWILAYVTEAAADAK
jgi:hypothetical protein